VAGLALAAGSVLGLAIPQTSSAQEASDKTEAARVEKSAYYTAEADGALPATVTAEFPPGIVCILAPQACSSQAAPITGLGGAVQPVFDASLPDWQAPQPVEPGTLPVGMLGGKPRYTSNVKFALPEIPTGSMINRFDLVLTQSAVSYALESPAFRQAVLAGLVTYQTRSPAEFTKFVGDVATATTPLAANAPTGIELCAITAAWESGSSADATTQPARDCIFGANGVYDAAARTWTFDLSLLAQAWLDGTTPNEGVYLGPLGAENLAFGDPDTSTNWQVSLGGADATQEASRPKIRYSYSEGFGDEGTFEEILDTPVDDSGGAVEDFGAGVVATSDPFSAATEFDDSALAGGTAPPAAGAGSAGGATSPITGTLAAAQSRPQSPWWLWLLLPVGLAMAYAFGRSIEDVPAAGRPSSGALSRLMASDATSTH
jgi:hypothetical protein